MKNKQQLLSALRGLLFDWGSDTPAEAVWAFNSLVAWIYDEFQIPRYQFEMEEDGQYANEILFHLEKHL